MYSLPRDGGDELVILQMLRAVRIRGDECSAEFLGRKADIWLHAQDIVNLPRKWYNLNSCAALARARVPITSAKLSVPLASVSSSVKSRYSCVISSEHSDIAAICASATSRKGDQSTHHAKENSL